MAREPLPVRGRHHPIPATVQEKGWSNDVGGVEAPRADACEIVVDEPAHAAGEGGIDDVDEPRPLACESGFVFGGAIFFPGGAAPGGGGGAPPPPGAPPPTHRPPPPAQRGPPPPPPPPP